MKKLNIAKLLKDCPTGMELDSTIVNKLYFDEITEDNMIKCYTKHSNEFTSICNFIYFYFDGSYLDNTNAKCVIFPKGKTTWVGFQRLFKDGDVVVDTLGGIHIMRNASTSYCYFDRLGILDKTETSCVRVDHLATEEEKQILFDAIKANGYKWNPKTKTLDKLEVNKFDITTLKPFDKVLVRDSNAQHWAVNLFGHYLHGFPYPFCCSGNCNDAGFKQCIPYEFNKHLLGTTNDCDDYFKTW